MNFRCRIGEIDIIARDGSYLCFVEVKYRSHTGSGRPDEAVDFRKQRNICKVADFYRVRHGVKESCDMRFDVVSICQDEIILYQNAFSYEAWQ